MKITLDIPDTTVCAFFSYVFADRKTSGMVMAVKNLDSTDLFDGNEIKIEPYKGGEDGR